MKQIIQNYRTGELRVEDVPVPLCRPGGVLVRTAYSLVSAGTERMKVDQARRSLVGKARARPDKVRQVLREVRQNGAVATYHKVRERLDTLTPLGYSAAGTVIEVGAGVDEFAVGDRVACAGEGIAAHAEFIAVPRNLCAPVPAGVAFSDAAFGTVGAIALQGVRQAGVTLGDSVLVIGLGLVGLLAVQILKAAGCRVIGIDLDPHKLELARASGADHVLSRMDEGLRAAVLHATGGAGADVAYVAASARTADPLALAGQLLRDRGRVVIVGMVRLEADWRQYYQKELSVVMSRSYGPGRYDPGYEQKGIDYPIGYVRWTEGRNLAEFLRLVGTGQVRPAKLNPEIHPLSEAPRVYEELREGRHAVGLLFEYPPNAPLERRLTLPAAAAVRGGTARGAIGIGLVGAGNFATATLIPALRRHPAVRLRAICSAGGLSARSAAQRHGFECCASGLETLLADDQVDAVVIATRHDTHARLAAEALRAGKHVFVEKPLALTAGQLAEVVAAQQETGRLLMPGFNRRFSPLSVTVRDFFSGRTSPIEVLCRVNAGPLPADSWYRDDEQGGWRILSEGCHFVDLIQFLCGCPPDRVHAEMIGGGIRGGQNDNCVATLRMADGSLGMLVYVANGDAGLDKERIEVHGQGRSAVIHNWQHAILSADGRARKVRPARPGKGHVEELAAFLAAVQALDAPTACPGPAAPGGALPIAEAASATRATLAIAESLATGRTVACS